MAHLAVAFRLGCVSFGIYTMALIQFGERFSGERLIAGNAAFSLIWRFGGMVGSPTTGLTMQAVGPQGLPLSLALLCSVLATFLMVGRRGSDRGSERRGEGP